MPALRGLDRRMNEASSKFVDQIAVEKLIHEKLKHVHHVPGSMTDPPDGGFDGLQGLSWPERVTELNVHGGVQLSFASPLRSGDPENDRATVLQRPARDPAGDLVFVHGLFEDNLKIYDWLFAELNKQGLNVHLLMLPYHYDRKPRQSLFSGEFFWSGDISRSVRAYRQAVYDLHHLHQYLRRRSGQPVWIVGFSMGGGVALSLAGHMALDGVFAINPVCNFSELVWTSTLFSTIRSDLEANGVGLDDVRARFAQVDPFSVERILTVPDRITLGRSLYDQINDPGNYDLLVAKWHLKHVRAYKAGHLNVLRAPRLAADIAAFCLGAAA